MSPELIGIISIGTGLAALIVGLFAWLRQDINKLDNKMTEQGQKHSDEITEVKNDLTEVKNDLTEIKVEVAALKATVETYFRVRVDPPPQAAVAEDPEDYGSN